MKVFFDTSVMIAACLGEHPDHERARGVLVRIKERRDEGYVAGHSLAEAYSVMTRLPGGQRVAGAVVWELLWRNVVATCTLVALSGKEYGACIKEAALGGIDGGRVYDALILAAARKAVVERVYTLNLKHFVALAPPELKGRVVAP